MKVGWNKQSVNTPDNLHKHVKIRAFEMMFGPTKGSNLRDVITHNVNWNNQKTELFVHCWQSAHAPFDMLFGKCQSIICYFKPSVDMITCRGYKKLVEQIICKHTRTIKEQGISEHQ